MLLRASALGFGLGTLLLLGVAGRPAVAQQPASAPPTPDPTDPGNVDIRIPKLLSVRGGKQLMDEAAAAISRQDYKTAVTKLQDARQVFNQLSTFYQQLVATFTGVDNQVAESQRRRALETAQLRDEATFQLALVHRAQQEADLAIPLLVQIIRSQQPTRELGQKAYQQLLELGFVDVPFPRFGTGAESGEGNVYKTQL